jgi:hypothetical protein
MTEFKNEVKIPSKGGLVKARKRLNDLRRKEPSPDLVKIIEEVTHVNEKNQIKRDIQKDEGVAARSFNTPEAGI